MKPVALSALLFAGFVVTMGGCTSSQSQLANWEQGHWSAEQGVALSVLGPADERQSHYDGEFRLGAGDNLGRAVYHNYVAIVRANPNMQYASGETTGN